MFIAVHKYRQPFASFNGKLTVFDTEDCSVEVADWYELYNSGLLYEQIANTDDLSCMAFICNINNLLPAYNPSFVRYWQHTLYIGSRTIKVINRGSSIEVNEFRYDSKADISFLYPALCGEYTVLRFLINGDIGFKFLSVAVHGNGSIEYWTDDYAESSNKGLCLKIDMLLGEV